MTDTNTASNKVLFYECIATFRHIFRNTCFIHCAVFHSIHFRCQSQSPARVLLVMVLVWCTALLPRATIPSVSAPGRPIVQYHKRVSTPAWRCLQSKPKPMHPVERIVGEFTVQSSPQRRTVVSEFAPRQTRTDRLAEVVRAVGWWVLSECYFSQFAFSI